MDILHQEEAQIHEDCEIQIGRSSWQNGVDISMRFAWRTRTGSWARGGEFPLSALPQMFEAAIREGYITLDGKVIDPDEMQNAA
jgi:hypothetical protein